MDAPEGRHDRLEAEDAYLRERRRNGVTSTLGRVLQRIVRHDDLAEVLGDVARFVDPGTPERVEIVAIATEGGARHVSLLEGADPESTRPLPGVLRFVIDETEPLDSVAATGSDGWSPERSRWLDGREDVRWSALPIVGPDRRAIGALVRFAEAPSPGEGAAEVGGEDVEADGRMREAAALAAVAFDFAEMIERLRVRAFHDVLTGLPNRAFLHERLGHEMERGRRDAHALGVLMLEIDEFEQVNEAFGRETGDRLLHDVAQRLSWVVRSDETVARFGTDTFVVVVRGAEVAVRVAERIVGSFDAPFDVDGGPLRVRPRIGLARWPDDGEGPEAILAAADTAMVHARRDGGQAICAFADVRRDAS